MKSPREILLNRHRFASAKLDAVRQNALGAAFPRAAGDTAQFASNLPLRVAWLLWRELVLPCRGIWAGLAAAWVVILAVNHATLDKPGMTARKPPPPSAEIIMVLQEQRRMLAELITSSDQSSAEPPKPFVPRPRGELLEAIKAG